MTNQADEVLVVFTPSGKRGKFPVGTPLLQAARYLNVDIDSVCGGRGICGRCQILVSEGEFAKFGITSTCLLYTSDAADEEDSVDLGGSRIIKKKQKTKTKDNNSN